MSRVNQDKVLAASLPIAQLRQSPKLLIPTAVGGSDRLVNVRLVKLDYVHLASLDSHQISLGPRIHSKSIHGFPKIHGYQHGYP